MPIEHGEAPGREAQVDRMVSEFRSAQSRRGANRSDSAADSRLPRTPQATSHVPAEYFPLYTYFTHRCDGTVVLTFEEVEAILGFALPAPARTETDWWSEAVLPCLSHSSAWTETGRTAMPSLPAQTVTFERSSRMPAQSRPAPGTTLRAVPSEKELAPDHSGGR